MFRKIPTDKLLHLMACYIISIVMMLLLARLAPSLRLGFSMLTALLFALCIGVIKEVRDSQEDGNHFCWRDLAYDAVGAALGCLTGTLLPQAL